MFASNANPKLLPAARAAQEVPCPLVSPLSVPPIPIALFMVYASGIATVPTDENDPDLFDVFSHHSWAAVVAIPTLPSAFVYVRLLELK